MLWYTLMHHACAVVQMLKPDQSCRPAAAMARSPCLTLTTAAAQSFGALQHPIRQAHAAAP